tara:strand:+ start:6181 stop:7140 length:960 start_codon:yes stop_codon:yes gene_type:complete
MGVSNKYRTFSQLMEDVSIDFSNYALEGMIEPQQLIKVATRVNYDLGLKIHRTKQTVIDVEHGKAQLPMDFAYINYAFRCGSYTVNNSMPSGTHVETFNDVPYVPAPSDKAPCSTDDTCKDVCVIKTCNDTDSYQLVQRVGPSQYRQFSSWTQLRISNVNDPTCFCPGLGAQALDVAEIKDGFLITTFKTGKVYISYQGSMENADGDLLVLDQPYCNEYYEYALKQRILENMVWQGENVSQQLGLVEQRLRAARNNALSFVNTPDFREMRKMWEVNRRAQYHNYYNMFLSYAPVNPRLAGPAVVSSDGTSSTTSTSTCN